MLFFFFFLTPIDDEKVKSTSTGGGGQASKGEMCWGRQQNSNRTIQIVQGIRLWFLPGVAEVEVILNPLPGEARFGMDIRRTEEVWYHHMHLYHHLMNHDQLGEK